MKWITASIVLSVAIALLFVACAPQASPAASLGPAFDTAEAEANRDGVFTVRGAAREVLPSPRQQFLAVGDGVNVDETGRALVRFADLLTAREVWSCRGCLPTNNRRSSQCFRAAGPSSAIFGQAPRSSVVSRSALSSP